MDSDILSLSFIKKIEHDRRRSYSLNNKNVYIQWKTFLDGLPSSKDEVVPRIEEKYALFLFSLFIANCIILETCYNFIQILALENVQKVRTRRKNKFQKKYEKRPWF